MRRTTPVEPIEPIENPLKPAEPLSQIIKGRHAPMGQPNP